MNNFIITQTKRVNKLILISLLACLPAEGLKSSEGTALTPDEIETEIKNLAKQIEDYRAKLRTTQDERSVLENTLEDNEKKIGNLLKKIEDIKSRLKKDEKQVKTLQKKKHRLEDSKQEQQNLIVQHVRAAYEIGRQEYLKVLLNQQDPYLMARMLTYYDYFNRARADEISSFNETISELSSVEGQLLAQREKLSRSKNEFETRYQSLVNAQNQRQVALLSLDQLIASTGSDLKDKLRDREHLENLMRKITANIAKLTPAEETPPFASLRGKLYLPVNGRIMEKFGSPRSAGKLRWNGLYIIAEAGTPVHSVHYGRVVFADWLRGFGLLLIISHGEGYMSLYGHNQLLYRETGDWVAAGEIVAKVGSSGGQKRPGLYFEVRQAGKPKDPQLWCRVRPDIPGAT